MKLAAFFTLILSTATLHAQALKRVMILDFKNLDKNPDYTYLEVCSLAIGLKYRLGYDDSLDVVGVHGVGGLVGMLAIGLFATTTANAAGKDGLFSGGGFGLLGTQALASIATLAYAFGVTWLIAKVLDKTMGFRVSRDDEMGGIDLSEHAETAYDITGSQSGSFAGVGHHGLLGTHDGSGNYNQEPEENA